MSAPEAWRTEAAAKIQKRHWDVIQEKAGYAADYLEWLQAAAMKEDLARAPQCAEDVRTAMNTILERLDRLDAIREMRDIYEIPLPERARPEVFPVTGQEK